MPRHRLRGHEHPSNINLKHTTATRQHYLPPKGTTKNSLSILSRIINRRRLLLYPRRSNQPINPPLPLRNPIHNLFEHIHIPDIDARVLEPRPQRRGLLLHAREFGAGRCEAVERVDGGAGFEEGFGLDEAKAAAGAGDDDGLAGEGELG